MLFSCLISLAAGYCLNEEKSLRRICQNLSYSHEGWLLLKNPQALWVLAGTFIIALIKGYGWGIILRSGLGEIWYPAGCVYVLANVWAAGENRGVFYTPWLALIGMSLAANPAIVQWSLTTGAAFLLFTRRADLSMQLFRLTFWLTLVFLTGLPESILWTAAIGAAWFFSDRLTPFAAGLIK